MKQNYSDNLADVEAWYIRHRPSDHTLTLQNVMEYARSLHDKEGYSVLNANRAMNEIAKWVNQVFQAGIPLDDANLEKALDAAGYETIKWLQSLTAKMRPPANPGEGMRRAHPGGWADISSNLAGAYQHYVDRRTPTSHAYSGGR